MRARDQTPYEGNETNASNFPTVGTMEKGPPSSVVKPGLTRAWVQMSESACCVGKCHHELY